MSRVHSVYRLECDNCRKTIEAPSWYRLRHHEQDFCTRDCAKEFRDRYYQILSYSPTDKLYEVRGNTD